LSTIALFGAFVELPFGPLGLFFYGLGSYGSFDTSNAFVNERTKGFTTRIIGSL
jgi:hypothetical protein